VGKDQAREAKEERGGTNKTSRSRRTANSLVEWECRTKEGERRDGDVIQFYTTCLAQVEAMGSIPSIERKKPHRKKLKVRQVTECRQWQSMLPPAWIASWPTLFLTQNRSGKLMHEKQQPGIYK
jgi:hypothetical protein